MPKFKPIILDEDCAPRRVLELFSVKWTTMVLHSLHFNGGTCRTGALARSLPGCSKKMLTQTLREMERDRLIDRKVYPVVPPMVEYSLTPMGRLFIEPIDSTIVATAMPRIVGQLGGFAYYSCVFPPGCGHWTQQERAQEVNQAVIEFVQRL